MKFFHRYPNAFALVTGFLSALSIAGPAYARGGPGGFGLALLVFALANLVLYVSVISFGFWGIVAWRRKRKLAMALIFLALLPFLHYSFELLSSQFEPERRRQQLASMTTQRVSVAARPRSLQYQGIEREVEMLVAVGVVDEIQTHYEYGDRTTVLTLHEGPECVEFETSLSPQAERRRAILARHAFQRCVKRTERKGPPTAAIRLFVDDSAPSRYTGPACLGGGNRPLELRWAPQSGGALIAFWESPTYTAHTFPPRLPGHGGIWQCESLPFNSPDYHRPDPFHLVATALGFARVEDYPKSSNPQIVPDALRILLTRLKSASAHESILALLGQWPSTPAIEALLASPGIDSNWELLIQKAATLLTEPGMAERRKDFYPYLSTHLAILNRVCSSQKDYRLEEPCARLAAAQKRARVR